MAISGESNAETGTSNPLYDLVSVLYHALQGFETCGQYLEDAEREGNEGLSAFFRKAQEHQRALAEDAKAQLRELLGDQGEAASEALRRGDTRRSGPARRGGALKVKARPEDTVQEASEESFPASDPPAY